MATQTKRDILLTNTFDEILKAWQGGKRRIFLEGGTWSSKTYSAMQFLVFLLSNWSEDEPLLATVSSESMPHLKRGAMLDFLNIMGDSLIEGQWNRSDFVYTFPNNRCRLEFVSDDHPEKFTGGRRDIHFWNELNNIHRLSYMEGDVRTKLFTIGDWNPYGEFWFHDDKLADEAGNVYIHGLTYHDTPEVVSKKTIETIESYKDKDPNYYRVHALGLLGNLEGLVYPLFKQVDELPEGDCFYGLDYGFSSDPTVLVKNVILGDKLYSQEMFYDNTKLTNEDITREMNLCGVGHSEPIWADRDELKSAEELRRLGFNVHPVDKAYYGREYRIKKVNTYYQYWTKDSLNCIKEQRNFRFIEDKEHPGRFTDKTTHQWSHGMTGREFGVVSYRQGIGNPYPSVKSERRPAGITRQKVSYPSSFRR